MSRCSARTLAAAVQEGEVDAATAVEQALARLDELEPLGPLAHRMDDEARCHAARIDLRRSRGEALGPLAGVPFLVKDTICTRSAPTSCGSRILAGWQPPYDATAVERLVAADAVPVGKSRCDEFGMGSSSETACEGPVRHPLDRERTPGGSSGGSAVGVAAGAVPIALGSDTGGSVRQPAALCGIVGVKPTYGRVSRWGLVAFGSSLDQIGPLAADVADAALVLEIVGGPDGRDATCGRSPVPPLVEAARRGVAGRRVGLLAELTDDDAVAAPVREAVERAAQALDDAGAMVERVHVALASEALAIYTVVAMAEASSNLARYDGVRFGVRRGGSDLADLYERTRSEGFGAEVQRRILVGTFALSAGYRERYYERAQAARAALRQALDQALARCDLLLAPTAPEPAFRLGERLDDPLAMYRADVCTVVASLGGHPAISLPAPRPRGTLPVGVQLIARHDDEPTLFAGAGALETRGFEADA